MKLVSPIAGINATSNGRGYWLVAADGGIFTFGNAGFFGSVGGGCMPTDTVALISNKNINGYFIATRDGQVRAFSPSQSTNCSIEIKRQSPCWSNTERKKVIISISKQRLWACEGRNTFETTAVTTGAYTFGGTPLGNFNIYAKQTNRYLTGADYRAHVDYWMPFYRGYGLHDAKWRSSFGGSNFGSVGSHGCVNMPPAITPRIYHWSEVGTPVSVVG